MDFIERWLGVSPDGGSGSLEMLYLLAIVAIVAGVMYRKHLRHSMEGSHSPSR